MPWDVSPSGAQGTAATSLAIDRQIHINGITSSHLTRGTSMNRTQKAWTSTAALAITLAVNTLGAVGAINNLSQKQISDMYPTLITPSPTTFSIWGVIYALLIASLVVMIVRRNDPYYQKAVDQITGLFWISCLLNAAWIATFSFVLVELSVVFIAGLAVALALLCQKLLAIREDKRWLLPLSFGLYTGWLFIATVVNVAAALVKLKWDGFGLTDSAWAVIILTVAIVLVIAAQLRNRNAAFPLPVAWAYFGIYHVLRTQQGADGNAGLLQATSLAGMVVLLGAAAVQLFRNHLALLPAAPGSLRGSSRN